MWQSRETEYYRIATVIMQLHLLITADVLNYKGFTVDQTHKGLTWQHYTIISDMHPCNRLGYNREKPSSHPYREGFLLGRQISGSIGAKLRFVFYNIMFGNALRRKCEAHPSLLPFSHCFLCSHTCMCVCTIACKNQINTWKQPPPKK